MGRAFEFRKERKFKRWGNMARVFTRIGKEITIAAKQGGTDPNGNPRLRTLMQTAKSENMPKENVERAIKKAIEKDQGDYKEVVYEGYGPHGVAFLIETATDNTNRTVANIRSYFNKFGGALGTSGSVEFMFDHKCVFKIKSDKPIDIEELEFELIDYGAEDVFQDDDDTDVINIYGEYTSFNNLQKYIEDHGYQMVSGGFERFPNVELKKIAPDDRIDLNKLIDKLEEDEDVQNVYHTMSMED
ncbi:MAG: YebC/PmpR family DNA-binding transcriptional regulator [Bacteroidales bacterium]|nr:YebC/PmpR family DNA-binding transcriptional regulator [Bacteroidales bacterium]MDD4670163.1 YebC/PmpR family DNA-binding transcriptional regulator [Bacteroidales bacterium]